MIGKFFSLYIVIVTSLFICCGPSSNFTTDSFSQLTDDQIETTDGVLEIGGFTAGGGFSESQRDAYRTANGKCSDLYSNSLNTFGLHRVIYPSGALSYRKCGDAVNETPFGRGYLYVYRPVIRIRLDPEDEVRLLQGIQISGVEAPQYSLDQAYSSYLAVCFAEIKKLKIKFGGKFIAASCGESQSKIRMSYSESHRKELPNLTIHSKMNIYLRANDPGRASDFETLVPKVVSNIELVDLARSFATSNQNSPEVYATHFVGAITKINLKTKKIVWEKNLTNPSPNSVRETTSINTSAVSRDGRYVVAGGSYGYLALLDALTGDKLRVLSCHPKMFSPFHYVSVHIADAGQSIYTVAHLTQFPKNSTNYNRMIFPADKPAELSSFKLEKWQLLTGKKTWSIDFKSSEVLRVGSNNGSEKISVVAKDRVVVFNSSTGEEIKEFPLSFYEGDLKGSIISGASFSDDMRFLAISAFSGVIMINAQSTKMIRRYRANLKFELGNAEISVADESLRAFDAHGSFYEWELQTGALKKTGYDDRISLNYNGPHNMPMKSLQNGRFFMYSTSKYGGGSGVQVPRSAENQNYEKICQSGPAADLTPLKIKRLGNLQIWSAN